VWVARFLDVSWLPTESALISVCSIPKRCTPPSPTTRLTLAFFSRCTPSGCSVQQSTQGHNQQRTLGLTRTESARSTPPLLVLVFFASCTLECSVVLNTMLGRGRGLMGYSVLHSGGGGGFSVLHWNPDCNWIAIRILTGLQSRFQLDCNPDFNWIAIRISTGLQSGFQLDCNPDFNWIKMTQDVTSHTPCPSPLPCDRLEPFRVRLYVPMPATATSA
jgi:hypothetical protein